MFSEREKSIARSGGGGGNFVASAAAAARARAPAGAHPRHSHGLEEFFRTLEGRTGLSILDWAGASQANINFITSLGHRLYTEDFYQLLEMHFAGPDFYGNQQDPARVEHFLSQALNFAAASFDGVLLWDMLEYLAAPLLEVVVARLEQIVRPGGCMLAIFHADEKLEKVPAYFYRIADAGTLLLSLRAMKQPARLFNNRAIERLFAGFRSVKFFLTRDNLREVVVRR